MAQKYNVIIYSVQVRSKMGRNMPPLETLSTETGGRIYKLNKDLDTIFRDINNELRSQYSLSYVSSSPGRAGAFHQVEVEMVNKKYKAQARKGYYGSDSE
jgi:VWFA-related protein